MGDILRTSPSGPIIEGTVTGDLLSWNNTTKEWDKVPASTFEPAILPTVTVPGVAVPALAAAGDTATVNIPVPGAQVGDVAFVISATLAATGVVISGTGGCLVANTITVFLVATKAYAGANETFVINVARA